MKKPKKSKSRRDQQKYPALDPKFMPRVRQELVDYDYIDKLSPEEKAWLNKFSDEYINASFKRNETDIQPYEKYGKDSNTRNNARNRCLYSALKNKANRSNNKKLVNYDSVIGDIESNPDANPAHLENSYIDFIDLKEVEYFLKEYDEAMYTFSEASENLELLP